MDIKTSMDSFGLYIGIIGSLITISALAYSAKKVMSKYSTMKSNYDRVTIQYDNLLKKVELYGKEFYCSLSKKMDIDKKVELIMEELNVKGGSIYIRYPFDESWHIFLSQITKSHISSSLSKIPFRLSSTSAGRCFITEAPQITNNIKENTSFNSAADKKIGFKTKRLLEYPIIHNKKVIAVLQLINKEEDFTNNDLSYLRATHIDDLQRMISEFLSVPNYIDILDIHSDILSTNRIIVAMDISNSQRIFKYSDSDITAIMIIKEYYNLVSKIHNENDGFIDNYMGDGILVSFNYSNDDMDEIKEIINCVIKIKNEFDDLKGTWAKSFTENDISDIHIRIGITIGEVKLVNIDNGYQNKTTLMGKRANLVFNMCNELPRNKSIVAVDAESHSKIASILSVEAIDTENMRKTKILTNKVFEIKGLK